MARSSTLVLAAVLLAGCAWDGGGPGTASTSPDYARPLPPGTPALRLVADPGESPALAAAWRGRDRSLQHAIEQSLSWFETPSSRRRYPVAGITHARARASLVALQALLEEAPDAVTFTRRVLDRFDLYESRGCDGAGTVLFTAYCAPELAASRVRTDRFRWPLHRRPATLVTDPETGTPLGQRRPDGTVVPWPARAEIESSRMLAGTELAWLEDPLSVHVAHVNGSARLRLPDGSRMLVAYHGKTDRPYTGLGAIIVKSGLLPPDRLSLSAIRSLWRRDPATVEALIARNESYVFFREAPAEEPWPTGSLGVPVTPRRTLATDTSLYPPGSIVLVETTRHTVASGPVPFTQFMLEQDTGGALQAPGRADIYLGVGAMALLEAGGQHAEGRMTWLLLTPAHGVADASSR